MFNYEWQRHIKKKYLDLAHAMQEPLNVPGDVDNEARKSVILNDIRAANELIGACQQYIAEQMEEWDLEG